MRDKNDDTNHYDSVLLEDMNHKFDVILEYLAPLAPMPGKVSRIDERLKRVESDVKVIKLAVKDQSEEHDSLVKQVTKRWNKR